MARDARHNGGIEISLHQHRPLTEHFQMLPNALLRGDHDPDAGYDFRGYTLRERAILGALAGMAEGYRCSRSRIQALAPELGVDALDTVLKGLRDKGHLRQTRVNDPDSGKFVWRWDVSLEPIFAAAMAMGSHSGGRADVAPVPEGREGDDPGDEEETAGQSMGGLSTHGSSMGGSAMGGQSGSKYLEDQGLENQPPPTPAAIFVPPRRRRQGGGGKPLPETPPPAGPGHVALLAVLKATRAGEGAVPRPRAVELGAMLTERLAAGWPQDQIVAALSDTLGNVDSIYATLRWRILNLLDGAPPPRLAPLPPSQRRPQCGTCRGSGRVAGEAAASEFAGIVRHGVRYRPCADCNAEVAA